MPRLLLAAAATYLAMTACAAAQGCQSSYYNHNGSQMRADSCGSELFIYYENPRQLIRKLGVDAGTLLFDGTVTQVDGALFIEGNARVFKAGCGAAQFRV